VRFQCADNHGHEHLPGHYQVLVHLGYVDQWSPRSIQYVLRRTRNVLLLL
jgi:hypothetical protein